MSSCAEKSIDFQMSSHADKSASFLARSLDSEKRKPAPPPFPRSKPPVLPPPRALPLPKIPDQEEKKQIPTKIKSIGLTVNNNANDDDDSKSELSLLEEYGSVNDYLGEAGDEDGIDVSYGGFNRDISSGTSQTIEKKDKYSVHEDEDDAEEDEGDAEEDEGDADKEDVKKQSKSDDKIENVGDCSKEMIDRWGMIFDPAKLSNSHVRSFKKTAHSVGREKKWLSMIKDIEECRHNEQVEFEKYQNNNKSKIKRRVRKGIPDSCRSIIWPFLTGSLKVRTSYDPEYYLNLLQKEPPEDVVLQIEKDLNRTFPTHVMFRDSPKKKIKKKLVGGRMVRELNAGQTSLNNVLRAFAIHSTEIRYCQGMGYPAATFLMYMSDEDAFWMLERTLLSEKYWKFGRIYIDGFPLLMECLDIHDILMKKNLPKLHKHFDKLKIVHMTYATRWFSTVYAEFGRELVLRIWDIFLYEGMKIVFRIAIALLITFEKRLLSMDWENIVVFLRDLHQEPDASDAHNLIKIALNIELSNRKLLKMSNAYKKKQTT